MRRLLTKFSDKPIQFFDAVLVMFRILLEFIPDSRLFLELQRERAQTKVQACLFSHELITLGLEGRQFLGGIRRSLGAGLSAKPFELFLKFVELIHEGIGQIRCIGKRYCHLALTNEDFANKLAVRWIWLSGVGRDYGLAGNGSSISNHRELRIASVLAPIESSNLMVSSRAPTRSIVAACLLAASIQLSGQQFGGA